MLPEKIALANLNLYGVVLPYFRSGLRICGLNDLPAKLRNSLPHSDLTPVKIKEKKMARNAFKLLASKLLVIGLGRRSGIFLERA